MAALQHEVFIDFVQEDVQVWRMTISEGPLDSYMRVSESDRHRWFAITPFWPEEGTSVTLEEGFDAKRVQLTAT